MVKHIKTGKITPDTSNRITIEVPEDCTVIVIKPNQTITEDLPRHKKVVKPDRTDTATQYYRIAESNLSYSSNNGDSDTDTDGFSIGRW